MSNPIHWITPTALIVTATSCFGAQYLTLEQAQKACFPDGGTFSDASVELSKKQIEAIEKESDVEVRVSEQKVWKVTKDKKLVGWFIVDEVIGKHELITYALAIGADGSVKSIEIMDYRESYGYQIRNANWRRQFMGKKKDAKLELNSDISNISGATLSCRHVTEGVKRLLAFYEIVLKGS